MRLSTALTYCIIKHIMKKSYALALLLFFAIPNAVALGDVEPVLVLNADKLGVDSIPAVRTALGVPGDYKPSLALLPSGELLLITFRHTNLPGGVIQEDTYLWRSTDSGATWSTPSLIPLPGREHYFTVFDDGTLFITAHILAPDVENTEGYTYSYVFRSLDQGRTWETTKIMAPDVLGTGAQQTIVTSRNVLKLADGTIMIGVSAPRGQDFIWKSEDNGATWFQAFPAHFNDVDPTKIWWGFMGETFLWLTESSDLLGLVRVDPTLFPPLPDTNLPEDEWDHVHRLVLYRSQDGGENWDLEPEIGSFYGEMYPAILELDDGRLMLTFTVRDLAHPLGVQAVFGELLWDGFIFDFTKDRLIIDYKTPYTLPSGGGFGPTVQLPGGDLITAYTYRGDDDFTHLELAKYNIETFSVLFQAGEGGIIEGETSQIVPHGVDCAAVTAVADPGYQFKDWTWGSNTVTDNPLTIKNVTANLDITANFINTYTVTFTAGPGGSLTGESSQTVLSGGSTTSVEAVAESGYSFVTWSGDIDSTSNPLVIDNVTKSMSISAVFTPVYTVTFTAGPGGSLTGNVSQTVVSGGSTTSVEAVAESGYSFVTWSGDIDSTSNPLVIDNVTKSHEHQRRLHSCLHGNFHRWPGWEPYR